MGTIITEVVMMMAVDTRRHRALAAGFALPEDVRNAPVNRSRDYPCHEIPIPSLRSAADLLILEDIGAFYETYYPRTKTQARPSLEYYSAGAST